MISVFKKATLPIYVRNRPKYLSNIQLKRSFHFEDTEEDLTAYFATLRIEKDSDQEQVRQAFLKLVKRFHPDSGSPDADVDKFNKIETAYRKLQNKFANERWNINEGAGEYGLYYKENKELPREYDIKHTAPQHRQYLSYGGYGMGTPTQRQKQYEKKRAVTAIENVHNHRIDKLKRTREEGLVIKNKAAAQKIKTRSEMDRLVEDLIQESMARGEFDNLAGKGKPLPFNHHSNPYVDFVTHKMNQVLIDNGFTPEWITLQKEIREQLNELRKRLSDARARLGPLPVTPEEEREWNKILKSEEDAVQLLNKKINQFNLVVPLLVRQLLLVSIDKEGERILKEGKNKLEVPIEENDGRTNKSNNYEEPRAGEKGLFSLLESLLTR